MKRRILRWVLPALVVGAALAITSVATGKIGGSKGASASPALFSVFIWPLVRDIVGRCGVSVEKTVSVQTASFRRKQNGAVLDPVFLMLFG